MKAKKRGKQEEPTRGGTPTVGRNYKKDEKKRRGKGKCGAKKKNRRREIKK